MRKYQLDDLKTIIDFAKETKVFKPFEVNRLEELLKGFAEEDNCAVEEDDEKVVGICYYAFNRITESTWTLWWLIVDKNYHGKGVAAKLMSFMEDDIKSQGGKQILIETGSLENMAPARKFYEKCGYEKHAIVKKYYSDMDDMVIFRKEL